MISASVIETTGLTKHYGSFEAVNDLSLFVDRGAITGFLGQNGAGKSSTIKMLLGMTSPTRGSGRVLGHDITDAKASVAMRQRVAYVAEDKRLYEYMTVGQFIAFTRAFYPNWRNDIERELIDEFRLPLDRSIKKLSKGMRTQTALLAGFARGAELLILDEPTEGLDPVATETVLQLVVRMAAEGASVFFSSHQITEVEQIADRVLLMDRGRLVLDTSVDAVKENFRRIRAIFPGTQPAGVNGLEGVRRVDVEGRVASVMASHNITDIVSHLRSSGATSVEVLPLTLKEVLLGSIGRR